MSKASPSLVERAAEIYDFASGLRVGPDPLPRPAPPVRPVDEVASSPASVPAQPSVIPAPEPTRPAAPVAEAPPRLPVPPHVPVTLDHDMLAEAGFILPDAPAGPLAEEVRLVKRRLLARVDAAEERGEANARIALIASGQPGEGKTFIAINLALSIAGEQDRAVLLVDGDTAKPDLPNRLGFEADIGFIDALADRSIDVESLVLDTDIPGLSILPAGRKQRNIPELLASARTEQVLERLLEADPSRIILIDSAPALAASQAGVLAGRAGQVMVVVRADQTSEADLRETIDLLSACPHVGLVLNSAALNIGGRRFGRYEEYR